MKVGIREMDNTQVRKFNSVTHGKSIYCPGNMSFPIGFENLDFCSQVNGC